MRYNSSMGRGQGTKRPLPLSAIAAPPTGSSEGELPQDLLFVFVPKYDAASILGIDPRSGIVGKPMGPGANDVRIYYEGNRNHASNIITYADRVYMAAGRLVTKYPTSATATVPFSYLTLVGTFNYTTKRLSIFSSELPVLASWLDRTSVLQSELICT